MGKKIKPCLKCGEKPILSKNGFVAYHKINGCANMMYYGSIDDWNIQNTTSPKAEEVREG